MQPRCRGVSSCGALLAQRPASRSSERLIARSRRASGRKRMSSTRTFPTASNAARSARPFFPLTNAGLSSAPSVAKAGARSTKASPERVCLKRRKRRRPLEGSAAHAMRASRQEKATAPEAANISFALAGCACSLASADELAPILSPDRIVDAPSTRLDPYPTFDNFAWCAFLALNWPALAGADRRGEPDRGRTVGDPGPRVWETFKSSYELFQIGPEGRPLRRRPLRASRAATHAGTRSTTKRRRSRPSRLTPNSISRDMRPGSFSTRSSPGTGPTRATRSASTAKNTTRSRRADGARAATCRTRPILLTCRSARSPSRRRGAS